MRAMKTMRCWGWLLLPVLLLTLLAGCASTGGSNSQSTGTTTHQFGVQAKTSGCVASGGLADPACTPGAIFPNATTDQICQSGYSSSVRNVPTSEKNQVYAEYGIASHSPGQYEVDHLVSLELGGSNDISNLWPEAASPTPGFHQKDSVENYLHSQVCSGAVTLQQAQVEIATNWLQVYQAMQSQGG
ncbi:MAG: HNH endonuclease signature motif containing protein [Ktedonobacterales bacterium]